MTLLEKCFYINLASRPDRLAHVTGQLTAMGIVGERFDAIKTDGGGGAIGCSMSHLRCLELARDRGYDRVFVCEDDIVFTDPALLSEQLQKFHESNTRWDVIVVGGNNHHPFTKMNDYSIQVRNCQTTTGYVVNRHYYDMLIENFREGIRFLSRTPSNKNEFAIDMYWKRLQSTGAWFMIIPSTVTQLDGFSDIEGLVTRYDHLMLEYDKGGMRGMMGMRGANGANGVNRATGGMGAMGVMGVIGARGARDKMKMILRK